MKKNLQGIIFWITGLSDLEKQHSKKYKNFVSKNYNCMYSWR